MKVKHEVVALINLFNICAFISYKQSLIFTWCPFFLHNRTYIIHISSAIVQCLICLFIPYQKRPRGQTKTKIFALAAIVHSQNKTSAQALSLKDGTILLIDVFSAFRCSYSILQIWKRRKNEVSFFATKWSCPSNFYVTSQIEFAFPRFESISCFLPESIFKNPPTKIDLFCVPKSRITTFSLRRFCSSKNEKKWPHNLCCLQKSMYSSTLSISKPPSFFVQGNLEKSLSFTQYYPPPRCKKRNPFRIKSFFSHYRCAF